ncbi:MAG: hypothetical protein CR993_06360 [Rhodobacterales bacterium]|nr:MAG: hypothetical protein CR993_06360 [Rhodobacterales bacterium]
MSRLLLPATLLLLAATPASAGRIERACLASDLNGTRPLCACLQIVADQTLPSAYQRRGAAFFRNPDLSQKTKMSAIDNASDARFWQHWQLFGQRAEATCG